MCLFFRCYLIITSRVFPFKKVHPSVCRSSLLPLQTVSLLCIKQQRSRPQDLLFCFCFWFFFSFALPIGLWKMQTSVFYSLLDVYYVYRVVHASYLGIYYLGSIASFFFCLSFLEIHSIAILLRSFTKEGLIKATVVCHVLCSTPSPLLRQLHRWCCR